MRSLTLLFLSINCIILNAKTIFVKQSSSGTNTGTSWSNAFTTIESAFSNAVSGDEIWVSSGVYKPAGNSSSSTFLVPSGIKFYGSFAGTETMLSQRNILANLTSLSGDVGSLGVASDNCKNIISLSNVNNSTRIDGFKIIGGYNYTPGGTITDGGAGIRLLNSSPTIANCIFTDNYAYMRGGAIYQQDGGTINILNCEFTSNTTGSDVNSMGGALFSNSGVFNIKDCNFNFNSSNRGGAIATNSTTVLLDRCKIGGNTSSINQGGALYIGDGSSFSVYNSLFIGNHSKTTGAVAYYSSTFNTNTQKFVNCTISGNKNDNASSAILHANPTTQILNTIMWDNIANEQIYSAILTTKPTVSNSIIQGGLTFGTNVYNSNPLFISQGSTSNIPFTTTGLNYALQNNSPAVNMGSNNNVNTNYNLDIDSTTRIKNRLVDIGAYESNSTFNNYLTITLSVLPSATGTTTGAGSFFRDSLITVSATPNSGYKFISWTENGTVVSTNSIYSFAINVNRNLIANFDIVSGIYNTLREGGFTIFPNPTSSKVFLKNNLPLNQKISIKIINTVGETVKHLEDKYLTTNDVLELDLSDLPRGNYYIRLESEKGFTTNKIYKQ